MKFIVRKAVAEDAEDITGLSNQLGYSLSTADTLQNLKTIRENKNEIVLVATHEEKIVGWIHAFLATRVESGSFCEIGGLVTDIQHRRMGIGKLLIEHIISWCSTKGFAVVRVRCNIKRTEAHDFYSKLGFSENKQQKIFEKVLRAGHS